MDDEEVKTITPEQAREMGAKGIELLYQGFVGLTKQFGELREEKEKLEIENQTLKKKIEILKETKERLDRFLNDE